MQSLFTYTIPFDDGAAPNPFNGMCTLAICKPRIRRTAEPNDWVAGIGSKNAPSGDLSKCLVYAMRVEEVLTMQQYDALAPAQWPHRRPNMNSLALQDRLGDCIYDYEDPTSPFQRHSVHGPINVALDLSGVNVLVSRDFYYFGSRARRIPDYLLSICHPTQGHKRQANAKYFEAFVQWVRALEAEPGQYGWPGYVIDSATFKTCGGCLPRQVDGDEDEPPGEPCT